MNAVRTEGKRQSCVVDTINCVRTEGKRRKCDGHNKLCLYGSEA